MQPAKLVASPGLAALVLAGCSSGPMRSQRGGEPMLGDVFGTPDSAELEMEVNTCNRNPSAQAYR